MEKVVSITVLPNYELDVVFSDGVHGVVSLANELFGPVFEPLKDQTLFKQVFIDECGAIAWPNGADIAPDALHEEFEAKIYHDTGKHT